MYLSDKKILYIRLDSSPLPEASDEIIVKDFNLESYFCTLLGKKLLEDAGLEGTMLYPGKLLTDFEKFDKEAYREIIRQWDEVLSALLISQSENDMGFIFKLPASYIDWLNTCDIPKAFHIKDCYANAVGVTLQRKSLFEIVNGFLKNKLVFFLHRNKGNFNSIVFSIDGINRRDCYIIHLWKHILTLDYKILTVNEFYYKIWKKNKFHIHSVVLGETLFKEIKQMHTSQDNIGAVFWDDAHDPLFSKEWFATSNSSGIVNLYAIKRNRDFPVPLKNMGFNWKMSYLDWWDLLYKLNFDAFISDSPRVLNGPFGRYFHAGIIARTPDYKLLFTFYYNNEDGLGDGGVTEKSQDTLNSIIVQTYNKEDDKKFLFT